MRQHICIMCVFPTGSLKDTFGEKNVPLLFVRWVTGQDGASKVRIAEFFCWRPCRERTEAGLLLVACADNALCRWWPYAGCIFIPRMHCLTCCWLQPLVGLLWCNSSPVLSGIYAHWERAWHSLPLCLSARNLCPPRWLTPWCGFEWYGPSIAALKQAQLLVRINRLSWYAATSCPVTWELGYVLH